MAERRVRMLTDADINAITAAMHGGMSAAEHEAHHHTFDIWIARENKKAEFYEKVKAQVGGWGVITVLATIGYLTWEAFLAVIRMKGA